MDDKYYAIKKEDVIKKLDSDFNNGLDSNQVLEKQKKYGLMFYLKRSKIVFLKFFLSKCLIQLLFCYL